MQRCRRRLRRHDRRRRPQRLRHLRSRGPGRGLRRLRQRLQRPDRRRRSLPGG
ncbi:hypothetical protein L6V77_29915 [Myxococcota bacterium]|nr:hypothetical protein [Myxococcota bacterium]